MFPYLWNKFAVIELVLQKFCKAATCQLGLWLGNAPQYSQRIYAELRKKGKRTSSLNVTKKWVQGRNRPYWLETRRWPVLFSIKKQTLPQGSVCWNHQVGDIGLVSTRPHVAQVGGFYYFFYCCCICVYIFWTMVYVYIMLYIFLHCPYALLFYYFLDWKQNIVRVAMIVCLNLCLVWTLAVLIILFLATAREDESFIFFLWPLIFYKEPSYTKIMWHIVKKSTKTTAIPFEICFF